MANNKVIELTQQELEDIKDEVKFRTMVAITLKELRGIPKRVDRLAIHSGIHWVLISGIILGIIMVAMKAIAR